MTKIFDINEIITIVMEEINCIETEEMYGISEEINLPILIKEKIEHLGTSEYSEFLNIIDDIVDLVKLLKTGELNELNKCHEEIMILAEKKLEKFLL